ncbi:MAG TPA: GNAT family N-acetyltransferase [Chryseolinea sp.]
MISPSLRIEPFDVPDLNAVAGLQPEGWPDIFPSIEFYCKSAFCFPLKALVKEQTVGIGTAIVHGKTAWLAHIIVHQNYRNSGIGSAITKALIERTLKSECRTLLLIATALGEPVYKKLGFEVDTTYQFFDHGSLPPIESTKICPFKKQYESAIFQLDRAVSGENRQKLLRDHLADTLVFVDNNMLLGFYIPTLGEGTIIADSPAAGLALMSVRAASTRRFCIPTINENGVNFLNQNGFTEYRRASRMILGEKISWEGSKIYSRIGGNLG